MFGVNDEGNIIGIDDMKQFRLDIENKINSNIEPIPDYRIEEDVKNKVLDNLIKVVLPILGETIQITQKSRAETTQTTQTVTEQIINEIKLNNNITLEDIAKKVGLTRDGVKYHITKLQKQGKIKHEGKDNRGYWIFLED